MSESKVSQPSAAALRAAKAIRIARGIEWLPNDKFDASLATIIDRECKLSLMQELAGIVRRVVADCDTWIDPSEMAPEWIEIHKEGIAVLSRYDALEGKST